MSTNITTEGPSTWRFDRTISPALLIAALLAVSALGSQSYVALTWANSMTAEMAETKRDVVRQALTIEQGDKRILDRGDERFRTITGRIDMLERDRAGDRERLTRVEEQFRWMVEALSRIEKKLDASRR